MILGLYVVATWFNCIIKWNSHTHFKTNLIYWYYIYEVIQSGRRVDSLLPIEKMGRRLRRLKMLMTLSLTAIEREAMTIAWDRQRWLSREWTRQPLTLLHTLQQWLVSSANFLNVLLPLQILPRKLIKYVVNLNIPLW